MRLLSFLLASALLGETASAQLVISEVLANPAGPNSGNQLIELHNQGVATVDLDRWALTLSYGIEERTYLFANARSIAPGAYLTVHWLATGTGDADDLYTESEGTKLFNTALAPIPASFALFLEQDNNDTFTGGDLSNPDLVRHGLQVGNLAQSFVQDVAGASPFWHPMDLVVSVSEGWSLVYDGTGAASCDWFGNPGGYQQGDNGIPTHTCWTYGTGCGGTGASTPTIQPMDQVPLDTTVRAQVTLLDATGNIPGLLLVGAQQASVPFGTGCTLYASGRLTSDVFTVSGNGDGNGRSYVPFFNPFPDCGNTIYVTFVMLEDADLLGLVKELTASNGLAIQL